MKKIVICLGFLFIPALIFAASPANSLWGLFKLGGFWMWVLLLNSILSMGFILEKFYNFYKVKLNSKKFFMDYEKVYSSGSFDTLKNFFQQSPFLISKVLAKAMQQNIKAAEFESRIERACSIEVNSLGKGLNMLATLGSVAPLIGFLGTVAGMITAFGNIAAADEVSAQLVAGGIYTALLTTAFGLIIAIPSIAMYNYFVHKIDNFVADTEKVTNEILNKNIIQ